LLICRDWLSNKLSAADIQTIVGENLEKLQLACAELVKLANENGGEDNITVIIARLKGDDLPVAETEEVQLELIDMGNIHDTADQDTAEII
jgi:serine/threonine protein phosphatase PrpC